MTSNPGSRPAIPSAQPRRHPRRGGAPLRRSGLRRHQPERRRRGGRGLPRHARLLLRLQGRPLSGGARPLLRARSGRRCAPGRARALASDRSGDDILAGAVSDYFDFLAARPNFVRLIEREALSPEADCSTKAGSHSPPARRRSPRISDELGLDDAPSGEAAHLLLSIIALCWFPLVHARTVAPAVGVVFEQADDSRAAQAPRRRPRASRRTRPGRRPLTSQPSLSTHD